MAEPLKKIICEYYNIIQSTYVNTSVCMYIYIYTLIIYICYIYIYLILWLDGLHSHLWQTCQAEVDQDLCSN
jgi:hypothetical protein